jgi:hypothetical protein
MSLADEAPSSGVVVSALVRFGSSSGLCLGKGGRAVGIDQSQGLSVVAVGGQHRRCLYSGSRRACDRGLERSG